MDKKKILGIVENILFTAGDSVEISDIARVLGIAEADISAVIEEDIQERNISAGLVIRRYGSRIQLATRSEYASLLQCMFAVKKEEELSRAMLETLSIIAYKQPVTRGEIEEIRGVNVSYTLNALLSRRLVVEAGRRESLGRPILYATGEEFLRHFGISSVEDLPKADSA